MMISDVKKSISAALHERTASPLYGTFIVSWAIWNWRIIYLTFFVSEDKIPTDKISYICENFWDIINLIIGPFFSVLFILILMPWPVYWAYRLDLKFKDRRRRAKNEVQKIQLLRPEESTQIREQIVNQAEIFEKLQADKNHQIDRCMSEIQELKSIIKKHNEPKLFKSGPKPEKKDLGFDDLEKKIKEIDPDLKALNLILDRIRNAFPITGQEQIPDKLITILEMNDVIVSTGNGNHDLAQKEKVSKLF